MHTQVRHQNPRDQDVSRGLFLLWCVGGSSMAV